MVGGGKAIERAAGRGETVDEIRFVLRAERRERRERERRLRKEGFFPSRQMSFKEQLLSLSQQLLFASSTKTLPEKCDESY